MLHSLVDSRLICSRSVFYFANLDGGFYVFVTKNVSKHLLLIHATKSHEFYAINFHGVFLFILPAGLVLYWLVSNLITIAQQQLIYRGLEKKDYILAPNNNLKDKSRSL